MLHGYDSLMSKTFDIQGKLSDNSTHEPEGGQIVTNDIKYFH